MLRTAAFLVLTGIFVLFLDDAPAVTTPATPPAKPLSGLQQKSAVAAPDKIIMAQAQSLTGQSTRQSSRRARPQVRVTPRYPYRTYHSVYPVPYAVEYPGPNGVRHCVNRYVAERRPSGTVMVPRMRCWWARS
jgi:hypothetical protein